MSDQTDSCQNGVVTYKGHVPNWMKQVTVDCGLRDIETAHANERRIVTSSVPLKAPLVFFRFGKIGRVQKNGEHVKRDGPDDQHQKPVKAPDNLGVPFKRDPPLQNQEQ